MVVGKIGRIRRRWRVKARKWFDIFIVSDWLVVDILSLSRNQIAIRAVYSHVPIQISRLRESVLNNKNKMLYKN